MVAGVSAHEIVRGVWRKIEPKPTLVQAMTPRAEIVVATAEPDLLDSGIELDQATPTEVPSGAGDLWARICPGSAYPTGTLQTLEAAPAEA